MTSYDKKPRPPAVAVSDVRGDSVRICPPPASMGTSCSLQPLYSAGSVYINKYDQLVHMNNGSHTTGGQVNTQL